ncbi:MAG: outer membrane protein assembly factor BamD [Nannocystaceae bacterium]
MSVARRMSVGMCLALASFMSSGCLVLKAEHDDLAAKVAKLERQNDSKVAELDDKLNEADIRLAEVGDKVAEAEKLLRGSQAGLGVRMDEVEEDFRKLRGELDQTQFEFSAVAKGLSELRADNEVRLAAVEKRVNEATNIPEGKNQLFAEAERLLKVKNYVSSRRLFRTYLARYPGDARTAEVKFKVGLTFYSERDFRSALGEFYRVIQEHRESPTMPDALYYSGLGFAKLGQCKNALAYFETILGQPANEQYHKAAQSQIKVLKADKGEICFDREDNGAGAAGDQGVSGSKSSSKRKRTR